MWCDVMGWVGMWWDVMGWIRLLSRASHHQTSIYDNVTGFQAASPPNDMPNGWTEHVSRKYFVECSPPPPLFFCSPLRWTNFIDFFFGEVCIFVLFMFSMCVFFFRDFDWNVFSGWPCVLLPRRNRYKHLGEACGMSLTQSFACFLLRYEIFWCYFVVIGCKIWFNQSILRFYFCSIVK